MAANRIRSWIVFFAVVSGLTAEAVPTFTFTCTCQPSSTINWRVIGSANEDFSGAITFNIGGSFSPTGNYPQTQGPTSGSMGGYSGQSFYLRWQVQGSDFLWTTVGTLPQTAVDSSVQFTYQYTPPNCIPTGTNNPDIPFNIGNNNPYGGTYTPMLPNGTPLPPPNQWPNPPNPPYTGPWPPYLGPGDSTTLIINVNNYDDWNINNQSDIVWNFAPGPPPGVTNTTFTTNITTTITNINGQDMTINLTNVTSETTVSGGLPSGGFTPGSAASGTELLTLAELESLNAIKGNTQTTTNVLEQIRHNQTNELSESILESMINPQRAMGEAAVQPFTNLLNVPVFSGETALGQGPGPVLVFTYAPGRTWTLNFNHPEIMGMISIIRAFFVYGIWALTAWMCWRCIEENVKLMLSASQFRNASTSIPRQSMKAALICAALIVVIWSAALALVMVKFSPHGAYLAENPLTYLTGFAYMTWFNSIVPIAELVAALFAYVSFRITAFQLASAANIVSRWVVGV